MRNKNYLVLFLFIAIFCGFLNSTAHCKEMTGQSIYEKYKDAICDIATTVHFKDGKIETTGGSGFFINYDGQLLTAAHVIKDELITKISKKRLESIKKYTYWVTIHSRNRMYRATLVGSNDYTDIAMMKIENISPSEYKAVKIGDPNKLKIGDKTWTIGNPNNLANSLTSGIVSSLHRNIGSHFIDDFIQTDCPINPGNSGCPVFNDSEEVIGIANCIIPNRDGLAFAQSISLAKIELLKKGDIKLPSTGFEVLLKNFPRDGENKESPGSEDVSRLKKYTELEYLGDLMALARESWSENSAIITSIDDYEDPDAKEKKPSAAKSAALEKGDLIISIDSKPISNGMDVRIFLLDKMVGDKIKIKFKRPVRGQMIIKETELTLTKRIHPSNTAEDSEDDEEEEESGRRKKKSK